MNKLTLLALLGTVDACWFADFFHIHHHKGQKHHMFHQSEECQIPEEDFLRYHEIIRQIMQKSYIQSVRGMYHEQYDPITEECFGEWIEPTWQKGYDLAHQWREDSDSITAVQMKDTTDSIIDAVYKNHQACQFEKVGDIWKHWCMDNLDTCLMKDGKVMDRIMEHGMDFIGIGYKLFTMLMDHDQCATDEQRIKEIADVVEDLSSASVMIHGFEEAWDPKELDHVTRKEYKKTVDAYKQQLKEAAEQKMKEMKDAMPHFEAPQMQMPTFEMPPMFGQVQWEQPQHQQFGWGQPQQQFDLNNFHLF